MKVVIPGAHYEVESYHSGFLQEIQFFRSRKVDNFNVVDYDGLLSTDLIEILIHKYALENFEHPRSERFLILAKLNEILSILAAHKFLRDGVDD
jgi:hypothetical protein